MANNEQQQQETISYTGDIEQAIIVTRDIVTNGLGTQEKQYITMTIQNPARVPNGCFNLELGDADMEPVTTIQLSFAEAALLRELLNREATIQLLTA